ncbi:hypothetical protein HK101_006830 [Irineochytrium annulatum]|nr:hypothetical protein HK101_006830 [Irineochytrium annulatum]
MPVTAPVSSMDPIIDNDAIDPTFEATDDAVESVQPAVPLSAAPAQGKGKEVVGDDLEPEAVLASCGVVNTTSILHWPFLTWLNGLMFLGARRPLETKDLFVMPPRDQASVGLATVMTPYWAALRAYQENKSTQDLEELLPKRNDSPPSLLPTLWTRFGRMWMAGGAFYACGIVMQLMVPLVLGRLIEVLKRGHDWEQGIWNNGYFISFLLFATQVLSSVLSRSSDQVSRTLSIDIKTVLIDAVYGKALRLSPRAMSEFSMGKIMNFINVDAEGISTLAQESHAMWVTPIQILATVYLLYNLLGVAVLPSLAIILLSLFLQSSSYTLVGKFQRALLGHSDARLKGIRELVMAIRVIKLHAWEGKFERQVGELRDKQVKAIKGYNLATMAGYAVSQSTPILMPLVAFVVYARTTDRGLDPSVIFPALALFSLLIPPLYGLPFAYSQLVRARVSWTRMGAFLVAEETGPIVITPPTDDKKESGDAIVMENCSFKWEGVEGASTGVDAMPLFTGLSLRIPKGKLTVIVGPVGSGKSSLLSAITGGMTHLSGSLSIHTPLTLSPQQPFLLTDTVSRNITFFDTTDHERLIRHIGATQLAPDVARLPNGITTQLGERGVNLSGGQRARVSIARAGFADDATTSLLDDPLASLDARVSRNVVSQWLMGEMAHRTRVLVTHSTAVAGRADWVVVMGVKEGGGCRVLRQGRPGDVLTEEFEAMGDVEADAEEEEGEEGDKGEEVQGIVEEEERRRGGVGKEVWWSFLRAAGGWWIVSTVVMCTLLQAGASVIASIWLGWWSTDALGLTKGQYMTVYGVLGFFQGITIILVNASILLGGFRAAVHYHSAALKHLLRSSVSFFESQPTGRIINRFSKDVQSLDQVLWNQFFFVTFSTGQLLSALTVVAIVAPYLLLPVLPILYLYSRLLTFYRSSIRELRRLDSTARSPLYSHLSETLAGLASVRAYGREREFVTRMRALADLGNAPRFLYLCATMWGQLRIEILAALVVLALSLAGVGGGLNPAWVGLALAGALSVVTSISFLMRAAANLESEMNSVERLDYYANHIPQEPPAILSNDPTEEAWPSAGEILVEGLDVCYPSRPDHAVIRSLNVHVAAGEKLGIIGRTGSGKSTLLSVMFRLMDPSAGRIVIDGLDIKDVGLDALRSRMQIITQDPVLFTGTVRSNLSLDAEYDDGRMWEVLEMVGLKEYFISTAEKLDAPIGLNGENLSLGQRQLLCLGRAIIRKPKILFLDEATASVDPAADALLQRTLRTAFASATVVSVAHRLATVATFDRVLVLRDGVVVEVGRPADLLRTVGGAMRGMAEAGGPGTLEKLIGMAEGME